MIADGYEAFLFDLDGVLYRGADPVPGAAEALARLRSLDKGIAFVTNNSGRSPQRVVVGEAGVVAALSEAGIEVAEGEPDAVDAVVVGWDRGADYTKLRVAAVLVQRGASLVATNPDASFPAADGTKWPGAGALLAAIETTTGVRGEVIGKPYPPLLKAAHARAGGGRPLLVGDRLDTDIAGAVGMGWDSLLVLTGISDARDLEGSQVRPTYVADDLRGLFVDP